jgi:ribonucleoside-triphosphate reductase
VIELPTQYQQYIHLSRYARWSDELGRRETWEETVNRYVSFFSERFPQTTDHLYKEILPAILAQEVMPSMRCLMTAGPALDKHNMSGYNCSYVALNRQRAFDEILYVLMCGTGVGFSAERQFVDKLPGIPENLYETDTTIVVADSKIGWARSFRELLSILYSGHIPKWDLSKIRPAGARLKTFGGRASGPEPLNELFKFTVKVFRRAKGRKLSSIECHDLVCKIAEVVVVGGVRRSALISLSNLTDERMRRAKSGQWWVQEPQRTLANNSVCYTEVPDIGIFMDEWKSLYESKSGERGIFSRAAAKAHIDRLGRRDSSYDFGTNPCSEILLRDRQCCNLSEVIARPTDTVESLLRKVRLATVLGTMQASLSDFRYISPTWKHNAEEEALLGVSLTGIMDHAVLSGKEPMFTSGTGEAPVQLANLLERLKYEAIETNKQWAKLLDVNPSTAVTCVKPSGTVSQLVDSASGIHPRYSEYYIRTVRGDVKDPLTRLMRDQKVPGEPLANSDTTWVFSFPIKSPGHSVMRDELSAIEQLELWKIYAVHWCEHKPSISVYVREHEWLDVGAWVYKNFDIMSGVSFFPYDDHVYEQAPYQPIVDKEIRTLKWEHQDVEDIDDLWQDGLTKEEIFDIEVVTKEAQYESLLKDMPELDWSKLGEYEKEDNTTGMQELACTGNQCEVV